MTDSTLEKEGDAFDYDETPENYLEVLAQIRRQVYTEREKNQ
jgi:hypothetical protein